MALKGRGRATCCVQVSGKSSALPPSRNTTGLAWTESALEKTPASSLLHMGEEHWDQPSWHMMGKQSFRETSPLLISWRNFCKVSRRTPGFPRAKFAKHTTSKYAYECITCMHNVTNKMTRSGREYILPRALTLSPIDRRRKSEFQNFDHTCSLTWSFLSSQKRATGLTFLTPNKKWTSSAHLYATGVQWSNCFLGRFWWRGGGWKAFSAWAPNREEIYCAPSLSACLQKGSGWGFKLRMMSSRDIFSWIKHRGFLLKPFSLSECPWSSKVQASCFLFFFLLPLLPLSFHLSTTLQENFLFLKWTEPLRMEIITNH